MVLTPTGYTNGEAAVLLAGLTGCQPENICKAIVLVMDHDGTVRLGCDSGTDQEMAERFMATVLGQRGWTVSR